MLSVHRIAHRFDDDTRANLEERVSVRRIARRSIATISLALASTFFTRPSVAEEPEPIAWTYRAPPDCPPAETFEREFRARTTRAVLVAGAPSASRSFSVTLSSEPDRSVGRLEIDGPAGAAATREVAGETCAGVVSALALVAALTVDPLAAPSASAASEPNSNAAPVPPKPSPATPNEARQTRSTTHGTRASGTSPSRVVGAAGLDGGAVLGLFPKLAPSASLFVEGQLEQSSVLAPSARLSLSGAISTSVAAPPGSAKFRWLAAALDGCPFEFRLLDALRATPCAFAEFGVLAGTGAGVTTPEVESRRWLALGGSARFTWLLFGSFFVEAQGRLEAPLARDTFVLVVPERVVVHAVPAVLGGFALGAGVRWP